MTNNASFLPEDYLDQKAEQRTNLISLVLFAVVMLGVFLAFLFTNEKRSEVKSDQEVINARYQEAAQQITELVELERQKGEMLQKAELAAALVERVPRSILLAELINRMPPRLGLLQLHLSSEKIRIIPTVERSGTGSLRSPQRGKTREEAATEARKVQPPKYQVELVLVGVAPTDLEVSKYLAECNAYRLLQDVTLKYSEAKEIEGREMREFRLRMKLDPEADVRVVEPWSVPRTIKNPMIDTVQYGAPVKNLRAPGRNTSARPQNERGK